MTTTITSFSELPPFMMITATPDALKDFAEALGTEERRKILILLTEETMTHKRIKEKTKMSRATVYRTIDALKKLDMVEEKKDEETGETYYHAKGWFPPKWEEVLKELDFASSNLLYEVYFEMEIMLNKLVKKVMSLTKSNAIILPEGNLCEYCEEYHSHYYFFLNLFVMTIAYYLGSDDFEYHLEMIRSYLNKAPK